MENDNTGKTLHTHAAHTEIGRDINIAKQRMYRDHEKGKPLQDAFAEFVREITETVGETVSRQAALLGEPPKTDSRVPMPTPHTELAMRAKEIIQDPEVKTGTRFHVERFLDEENWDALALVVHAINNGESYDQVLIANDENTLSDEVLEAVCAELCSHLDGEHLAGYLIALIEHIYAACRNMIDAGHAAYEIKRLILRYNAHAADDASEYLRSRAMAHIREEHADEGSASDGSEDIS